MERAQKAAGWCDGETDSGCGSKNKCEEQSR